MNHDVMTSPDVTSNQMTTAENKSNGKIAKENGTKLEKEIEQHQRPTFSPRFDVWEAKDEIVLYGDLPGVAPEHLDITFENRELTIRGRVDRSQTGITFFHHEFGVGDFYREFLVGESIDGEKIDAELRDGVLTVHLPKADAAKPRQVEVRTSGADLAS